MKNKLNFVVINDYVCTYTLNLESCRYCEQLKKHLLSIYSTIASISKKSLQKILTKNKKKTKQKKYIFCFKFKRCYKQFRFR